MKRFKITDSNNELICTVDAETKREAKQTALETILNAIEDKHKEVERMAEYVAEIAQAGQKNIEEL